MTVQTVDKRDTFLKNYLSNPRQKFNNAATALCESTLGDLRTLLGPTYLPISMVRLCGNLHTLVFTCYQQ